MLGSIRKYVDLRFCAALIVLIVVATFCYDSVKSANQNDHYITVIRQQSGEIAALRAQSDSQLASFRHQLALSRKQANHVAAVQRYQNNILIRALRHAGIHVPKAALLSGGGGRPKVPTGRPRHHNPGTPRVTGRTPSPDSMLCQFVPALCPYLTLPLLPKPLSG